MNVRKYSKAIVAASGAISVAVTDGVFDTNDAITIVLAVLAVVGVYAVPNTSPLPLPPPLVRMGEG